MHKVFNIGYGESLLGENKINFLKYCLNHIKPLKGAVAEVGVYKGGSARIITNTVKDSEVYLFDTFTGIPFESQYDPHYNIGDFCDSNYESVCMLFKGQMNVKIFKGIFPDETSKFIPEDVTFKFVHLDIDVYDSYLKCLSYFYQKMIVGGLMLFDDYTESQCLGAKKAVDKFFDNKEIIQTPTTNHHIATAFVIKK